MFLALIVPIDQQIPLAGMTRRFFPLQGTLRAER
jgi:hypothetical protein